MIRICALDFLNRDSFESDVKLADGKVIIAAGEKITPELILMLYFKEIYVDLPLSDVIPVPTKVKEYVEIDSVPVMEFSSATQTTEAQVSENMPVEISGVTNINEVPQTISELVSPTQAAATTNVDNNEVVKEPVSKSVDIPQAQTPISPPLGDGTELSDLSSDKKQDIKDETDFLSSSSNIENDLKPKDFVSYTPKAPIAPELDLSQKEDESSSVPSVDFEDKYLKSSNDSDLDLTQDGGKNPVAPSLDIGDDEFGSDSSNKPNAGSEDIEQIDRMLKFDEDVAKELTENAILLAKELNMPSGTIADIEKAAMACNIGIEKFTIEEFKERDFETRKANTSYEMAIKKGIYSNNVLEIIKCHAKSYQTENFNLNPTIPASDILHIANSYSKYKYIGMPKDKALLKMLEQGGNQFNIFALHKFLRLMRKNG